MSPIGFVGREKREGLEDARARTRAASFWKKKWRVLLGDLTKNISEAGEECERKRRIFFVEFVFFFSPS